MTTVLDYDNYRSYLKSVLIERENGNPSYSLRALARKLGVAPSYLSSLMSGSKNLSLERAFDLAARLSMNAVEGEYFCLLVQMESSADPELKNTLLQRAQIVNPRAKAQDLSLDHFKVISDWYHFAILAATELQGQSMIAGDLARSLGITKAEAEVAFERLERLEMLEKDERGRYRKTAENPRVVSHAPNLALRKYHKQTLTKAIESLETQTPQEKIVGSETLAIDASQLQAFRDLTERFFDEVVLLARKSKKKNKVYHLGVQFFDLAPAKSKRGLR